MNKTEFSKRVKSIADNMVEALKDYNEGLISINDFQVMIAFEMGQYPFEYGIATEQECIIDPELEEGKLYHVDYMGGSSKDFMLFAMEFIKSAPDWDASRFTETGSNSFLLPLVGEEGIHY